MRSLAALAVRRPITTAMFFLAVSLLGVISWTRLPVQLFPELVSPQIFVSLTLQGASPEQIERELVMPVEGEIGKLEGLDSFEANARTNRGQVTIYYSPGTDMKYALLQVQSRLAKLQPLFPERTRVNIQQFDSADLSTTIMQINVLGEGDLNWLRDFTEEKIRPELEAIDGVINAQPLGGRRSAVEIIVDPFLLEAYGITMDRVRQRINAHNRRRAYLGRVYEGTQAFAVSIQGQFTDLQQMKQLVVVPNIPLKLEDIAEIRYGLQERTDLQRLNGKESVGIRIQKDAEANLIEISREVERTIERLNRDLASETIELVVSNSQAELMEEALNTLKQAAVIGALLGLFVLFLFLRNLRFVTVLLLAIPASLLMTFNLMYAWDLSLNVLSLCGLALAVGMLTDNGIVVMENIFKHFEQGKSPQDAARDGAAEVSKAVVAATATTVMVFVPVVFIQSDAQDILRELALSMTFPLMASLLVALTLVPALSAQTLSLSAQKPPESGRLMEMYTLLLKASLRHRVRISIGIALALVVTLMVSFVFMLQQQVTQEESQFSIYASLPEGATLDATDEVVRQIEDLVQDVEGVDQFTTSVQENQASLTVMMKPLAERSNQQSIEEIKEELDEGLQEIQGGVVSYDPITTTGGGGGGRGGARGGGTGGFNFGGGTPSEQAFVRGYDFEVLQTIADDLSFRLEEMEGLINANSVRADAQRSSPEIQVLPDPFNLFEYGLDVRALLTAVEDASPEGFDTSVPFMNPDGTEVNIDVRNTEDPEEDGPTYAEFKRIPIQTAAGAFVPLEELARIRKDDGRAMILRSNQTRRAIVSYQFENEILDSQPLLDEGREVIQALVQDMVLPEGYTVEIVEAEEETIYYWMMAIAGILIYMILASLFESFSAPIIILCTLPTAVIGACWALVLSGTGLTSSEGPMALLGFIVLLGIAVNNGIILIDAIGTLRNQHGFRRERAVLAAGRSRVRPILMTSATTLLGVLPLALKFGGDYEVWPPFAITVLGGLTVSMLSTLIFIPVVYMGLDQVKDWLKDIGVVGIGLAVLAAGAASYGIHLRYQSMFWTCLVALPFWFLFLGLVWGILKIHRARREDAHRLAQPVEKIELRNLTKIYGAPGRFRTEWNRFTRRNERLIQAGVDPVNRKAVRDSMWWKLPLLALLVYLNIYFESDFWIYVIALATWGLLAHLRWCISVLWTMKGALPSGLIRPGGFALKYLFLPAMMVGYLNWHLEVIPPAETEAFETTEREQVAPVRQAAPNQAGGEEEEDPRSGFAYKVLGRHLERVQFGGEPVGYGAVVLSAFALVLLLILPQWIRSEEMLWEIPLLVLFLGYIDWRLGLISVTIASASVWVLYHLIGYLSDRVKTGQVDPDQIKGRLSWPKRLAYQGASAVPLIGVPSPEFQALAGVDLEIERGMFGLLGPNGAGKTTLMRIVCQVLESSYGSVLLNGRNILQDGKLQGLIGYLPQHFGLYLHLSAFDFLDYRALLEGFKDGPKREKRVMECLDQVNLLDRKDDPIGSFSGGMKQRVGIAQTLLHMPQIVVVDEPTAGLDPMERIRFRNLLARVSQERIVIFSTHIVEDISGSCNRLAVLKTGKLLYSGTPQSMRDLTEGRVWEALIPEDKFIQLEENLDLITHVRNPGGVRARFLAEDPLPELDAQPVDPNLEDAYLFLLRHGEEALC